MSAAVTQSVAWSIGLWIIRVLVAIPFFIAAWHFKLSKSGGLASTKN